MENSSKTLYLEISNFKYAFFVGENNGENNLRILYMYFENCKQAIRLLAILIRYEGPFSFLECVKRFKKFVFS